MTRLITSSSAYVGCYSDGRPWPWWITWPLCVLAGLLFVLPIPSPRHDRRR